MIRRLCLAAAALMLMASPLLAEDDAFVFRQVKWGMSLEEVVLSEVDHGDGTSPAIYVDQSGLLRVEYELNPSRNYDGPLCRMVYSFNYSRESKPNTSLSEIIIAIRAPVSDSLADYYSRYLGLELTPCEGFKNCLVMTKQALIKKYGSPGDDDPVKMTATWEKPGMFIGIWGTSPETRLDILGTETWEEPWVMSGDVVIMEFISEKSQGISANRP